MKKVIFIFLAFSSLVTFSQRDSLPSGHRYAEDQLYITITYNQFFKRPIGIGGSDFSYGFSGGFIKDFILNKRGSFAFALGVGYNFDFLNHKLKIEELNGATVAGNANAIDNNEARIHNLEFPVEIRFRSSNTNIYEFWRFYMGVKFSYNIANKFEYLDANTNSTVGYTNVSLYKKLQYGLTFSGGYGPVNLYFYYQLTPMFENLNYNNSSVDTALLKFGIIFYIL